MVKAFFALSLTAILILFFSFNADRIYAQSNRIWSTVVGDPNQPQPEDPGEVIDPGDPNDPNDPGGTGGGDDGLGPGEFKPPFRCGLTYLGSTYVGHTNWAVDFNRGGVGVDYGDPVLAVADGVVKFVHEGNSQVWIQHEGGYLSSYAHMSKRLVTYGDRVKQGDKIGEIGDTCYGYACGSHLHYHVCREYSGCIEVPPKNTIMVKFNNKDYPVSCYSCLVPLPGESPVSCTW